MLFTRDSLRECFRQELDRFKREHLQPELSSLTAHILEALNFGERSAPASLNSASPLTPLHLPAREVLSEPTRPLGDKNFSTYPLLQPYDEGPVEAVASSKRSAARAQQSERARRAVGSSLFTAAESLEEAMKSYQSRKSRGGAHRDRVSISRSSELHEEELMPMTHLASMQSLVSQPSLVSKRASAASDLDSYGWMSRHRKSYKEKVFNVLAQQTQNENAPLEAETTSQASGGLDFAVEAIQRVGAGLWVRRHEDSYRQLHLLQHQVVNAAAAPTDALFEMEQGVDEPGRDDERPDYGSRGSPADISVKPVLKHDNSFNRSGSIISGLGNSRPATTALTRSGTVTLVNPRAGQEEFRVPKKSGSNVALLAERAFGSSMTQKNYEESIVTRRSTRHLSEDFFAGIIGGSGSLQIRQSDESESRWMGENFNGQDYTPQWISRASTRPSCFYIWAAELVQSSGFAYAISCLIFMNAIVIGVQTDFMARNWTDKAPIAFEVFSKFACSVFVLELCLRVYVFRQAFFYEMPGWSANIFDLVVVSLQVVEEVFSEFGELGPSAPGVPLVRVLRLLRLVRVASLLHLLTELRMLVISIADSIKSVVWVLFLLFMIMYCIGIYFTQVVTAHKVHGVLGHPGDLAIESNDAETITTLDGYYGTLPQTMLTLFEAIAGGVSWRDVSNPLTSTSGWVIYLFLGYVFFTMFVVLNVVTGVFVGSATEKANEDRKKVLMFQLRSLFRDADVDGTGTMNWAKFQEHLDNPKMQMYLKAIDLHQEEALDLFHLLDVDDSDEVSEDEFVNGCLRLHGYAKSIDLATLMFEYKRWCGMWSEHAYRLEKSLDILVAYVSEQEEQMEENAES